MNHKRSLFVALALAAAIPAEAGSVTVSMHVLGPNGPGRVIGTVKAADTPGGLVLTPDLVGLTQGPHGFHVHAKPSCATASKDGKAVPGLGAGGHYDPASTGRHEGPAGKGHLGDLPPLVAGADGHVKGAVKAPRLKVADLRGRALVIHAGGDNFADTPKALGGGGGRVACGVVP